MMNKFFYTFLLLVINFRSFFFTFNNDVTHGSRPKALTGATNNSTFSLFWVFSTINFKVEDASYFD
uniref:Putative ovule protein n=1 Tax=Solanum chacoense TaxID=4108 RepID=A0A0V0GN06_SOLCH